MVKKSDSKSSNKAASKKSSSKLAKKSTQPKIVSENAKRVTLDISWQSIIRIAVALILFWALLRLQSLIFYLLFSVLFAVALHPLVKKFESWGIKRGVALSVSLMVIVGSFLALLGVALASLTTSVIDFVTELPAYLDELQDNDLLAPVATDLKEFFQTADIGSFIENGLSTGSSLISGASKFFEATLFIFFFTVYMSLENNYLIRLVRSIIPDKWQDETSDIFGEATQVIGGYIRGQFITSLLMGLASYAIYRILGVPNAAALAIIAGLTDVIPVVGGFLGLIPAVLIAATVSPIRAVLTIILVQTYSTINNNVIMPRVYGQSLDLSPFLVALSTTVGLMLFGAPGILLALPIAAIVGFALTKYKGIPIIQEDQGGD